jgi:hypothetical protein
MYTQESINELLSLQCKGAYRLDTKRPGIYQVSIPAYYEDGDVVDIFLEGTPEGKIRISDYGMALMRLSYDYDIDSPNKESILTQIVANNRAHETGGIIYIDVEPEDIYPGILQLAGCISKIGSMKYFKKEVVQSLFYELVESFLFEKVSKLHAEKSIHPILERSELEVDYVVKTPVRPLFIYAVKGGDKAKNVVINCLSFQKENIPFTSVIIHENMEDLSRKDRTLLTNTVDKQFTSFDAFASQFEKYVERESRMVS